MMLYANLKKIWIFFKQKLKISILLSKKALKQYSEMNDARVARLSNVENTAIYLDLFLLNNRPQLGNN